MPEPAALSARRYSPPPLVRPARLPSVHVLPPSALLSVCAGDSATGSPLSVSSRSEKPSPYTGSLKARVTESTGAERGSGETSTRLKAGATRSAASSPPGEPPCTPLGRQAALSPHVPMGARASRMTSERPRPSVLGYQLFES